MMPLSRKSEVSIVTILMMAAAFAIETPNMVFEIDDDASNARFAFPRNTARDKDFWRLILDDGDRRNRNPLTKALYARWGCIPVLE